MTASTLIGRQHEAQELTELLGRTPAAGQSVVLLGDPGIGKSALLGAAGEQARSSGFRVLTATGVQSEAQLPFAGLHQLLHPVLDRADGLRPVHRDALQAAFGLSTGPQPELFLIALAAENLIATVAAERPVAVLADDVQWLDPPTQEVLTFMARRAGPHPVVIIGAARTGHPGPYVDAGLPELELHGVGDAAAAEILRTHAGTLGEADRLRIQREAQGNPLALLELPAAWLGPAGAPADWQPPTLSARLERAFAGRVAELPPPTRDAVLIAAIDPVSELAEILAATSEFTGVLATQDAFGPAADAGLLRIGDGLLLFRHPLVRSGILQAETLTRRQAANAAVAAVLAEERYRRTWHRAQSIIGPDDQIADELEANVTVALSRGGVISAISDLQRSAQLTSSPARRGRRLLMAAEHAFGLGRAGLVDQLVSAAAHTDLSELDWARMQWLREIFHDGVPGDATRVFELCAIARTSIRAGDRDLALNLLLGAAMRCWWADTGPAARSRVAEAASELPGPADDPRRIAALAIAEPVLESGTVMNLLSRFSPGEVADAGALRLLGMAAHAIGDTVRAIDFLGRSETMLREQGQLGLLSQVLIMQVIDWLMLGYWDRAAAAAAEGERLARETGQPIWSTGTLVCDALNHAFRGQAEQALRYAGEVELVASRQHLNVLLSCVQLARGSALLVTGEYAQAYQELRRLFEPTDPSFHQRQRFLAVMFLADAAVRAGRREDARDVIAGLERVATMTPSPMLRVYLSYARAILSDDGPAGPLYADLMGQDLARWPWARARAELAYGSWLRRQRRYAEANEVLAGTEASFASIGAATWAAEARRELSAAAAGMRADGSPPASGAVR
jgi:hypothetical protein